ncbi:proline--tRNA ligase [Nonomuraea glycinis]|uniref:Proline--tRNA ligase n=1 Tax=Nonomuraea glycinis TaxID=2047744 RepID=A0A918A9K9_9ACTN|nr:proline--tRNA ligase [Nonomuraea glycinis]MCA2182210.1 proline--tRNA ligase [Nonomuraea glycinis]WSG63958.1 proline--tRNA ligase [Nonomuraea glycinis]GGP11371.1 proline--tRNA ligase [Nonomuraea glycinis]
MLLRMSSLFLRTLRDDPADAEVPSHKLLVRAGYVRRVAPGIYSWLPLGKLVLENVTRVVREEMNRMGGQEVLFPALLPREYYEATGRWTEYGDTLFRLRDRKGADYLLGPTHEELFTDMVKGEYSSYKDYPVTLYQIQTKYRDEARPRAGILRGREFLMKDSYSFDLDDDGLKRSYEAHRDTYIKTFDRLGITYKIVFATSGAMGGSASEEFLAPTPTGEDTFVACRSCGYAANAEAVTTPAPAARALDGLPEQRVLDTPGTPTIDSLVSYVNEHHGLSVTAADTLKNVVVKVATPGSKKVETLVIGVPGDREVDFKRLEAALAPGEPAIFEAEDFAKHPGLVRGYIGPQVLRDLGIRYLVDPRVATGTAWVTGANQPGKHAAHVVAGRDFEPDGTIEAAEVRAGDSCPRCGAELSIDRGIEIGHIFQLGRKYADVAGLDALGPDGKPIRITMGSYGVGVSRAVAVIAEQSHDELGLVWPREIAPADVHIVGTGKDRQVEVALELAAELESRGLRVLVDDRRQVSPGVKFKDAELLGLPTVLVVGRGLNQGVVELRDRVSGDKGEIPLAEAVDRVVAACSGS